MNFNMQDAIQVLECTPKTLEQFLIGLSDSWLQCHEGKETWNIYEIVEHLIEAEENNWVPRLEFIREHGESLPFPEFDRFSHLNKKSEATIVQNLNEFKTIRAENISKLEHLIESEQDLELTGKHPAFGVVKLRELISSWVVHDLTHLAQIVRVMAKRYGEDVGPWEEYLGILNDNKN